MLGYVNKYLTMSFERAVPSTKSTWPCSTSRRKFLGSFQAALTLRPNKTAPLGFTCKHGEIECLGDAHQLCFFEHLDTQAAYAAVSCQNFQDFPGTIGKIALARRCTETVGADWWDSGVGECVQGKNTTSAADELEPLGKEAKRLFKRNVRRTVEAGIHTSCTIEIGSTLIDEGKRYCVVDGGVWRGCNVRPG